MSSPRLVLVTTDGLSVGERGDVVRSALAAVPAGAAMVILRDTGLEPGALLEHAAALEPICRDRDARLHVPVGLRDVGARAGATVGWHLADRPESPALLRRLREEDPALRLSASTHDPEAAIAAAACADVVLLGPIWPTSGKPDGLGPRALAAAAPGFGRGRGRLFAIGGVTDAERARAALAAGAGGVAGIRAFADPRALAAISSACCRPS